MPLDPYYSKDELQEAGFRRVGDHVRISRKCSLYAISGTIGSHVRVDDFCILKGHLEIGNHVHICAFCSVSGVRGRVVLEDFSTLSNRISIFTGSDDYRADALSSSTVPEEFLVTIAGDVVLKRAALVGAHSVILPGVTIHEAASVGALCVVHKDVPRGAVVVAQGSKPIQRGTRDAEQILRMASQVLEADARAISPCTHNGSR